MPSLLNWHFTDRYYHSSFDTPDKTSAAEMRNVAVAVAASAWVLSSADESLALAVADLVSAAGHARIRIETRDGAKLAGADVAAVARESTILAAWRKWYSEAVLSVERLAVTPLGASARARVARLAEAF